MLKMRLLLWSCAWPTKVLTTPQFHLYTRLIYNAFWLHHQQEPGPPLQGLLCTSISTGCTPLVVAKWPNCHVLYVLLLPCKKYTETSDHAHHHCECCYPHDTGTRHATHLCRHYFWHGQCSNCIETVSCISNLSCQIHSKYSAARASKFASQAANITYSTQQTRSVPIYLYRGPKHKH